jgi:hypothetical protein
MIGVIRLLFAMDLPNLDFLSPNERDRYIKEQLEETRKQRIKEARRTYSSFTKDRQQKYAEAKKIHERRQAQIAIRERNAEAREEIEAVTARLKAIRSGIGGAHRTAVYDAINAPKEAEEEARKQAELNREIARRYSVAIAEVHENDPRIPLRERAKCISDAKSAAAQQRTRALEDYAKEVQRQADEQLAVGERVRDQQTKALHPKIVIDYGKTFFHADVGYLPITDSAREYGREIRELSPRTKEMETRKQMSDTNRRSAAAAQIVRANHDEAALEQELDAIRRVEVGDELKRLKENPQKEHPSAETYSLEHRHQMQQARMNRFLALNEEAPKPRGPAPQPQPMHQILPSPVASASGAEFEEEEEER